MPTLGRPRSCDLPGDTSSVLALPGSLAIRLLFLLCQSRNTVTRTGNQPAYPVREQERFRVIHHRSQLSNKAKSLAFVPGSKDSRKKKILIRFKERMKQRSLQPPHRQKGRQINLGHYFCKPHIVLGEEGGRFVS